MTIQTKLIHKENYQSLKDQWGWFIGLGVLILLFGILAAGNLFLATLVSVLFLGGLLFVNGVIHIVQAFRVKNWSEALWFGVIGGGYSIAGIFVAAEPDVAALGFTLFIGSALFIAGICRLIIGFRMRALKGWGWITASAFFTLLVALIILVGWPINGFWLIGLFLAVDLITQGLSLIALGLSLQALNKQ